MKGVSAGAGQGSSANLPKAPQLLQVAGALVQDIRGPRGLARMPALIEPEVTEETELSMRSFRLYLRGSHW